MRTALVACATKHGSTREVAAAVAAGLRERGYRADLVPAGEVRQPIDGVDLVVLGAPIYSGRWHRDAHRFLRRQRAALAHVPVAVFGMGPRRADDEAWRRSAGQLRRALASHDWLAPAGLALFGGVDPPRRGAAERRDLRDWGAIGDWAHALARLPDGATDGAFPLSPAPEASALNAQTPLPHRIAWAEVARCVGRTAGLLASRRVRQPREHVGRRVRFADGTSATVYRETVIDGTQVTDPCVLVVEFRLHLIRGWGHAVFRWESLLNTPLFVGFPGFRTKLWMTHDEHGVYRGIYQWDSVGLAQRYARSLWRVLALGSVPGSIHYMVLPGLRRDDVLDDPHALDGVVPDEAANWWRPLVAA